MHMVKWKVDGREMGELADHLLPYIQWFCAEYKFEYKRDRSGEMEVFSPLYGKKVEVAVTGIKEEAFFRVFKSIMEFNGMKVCTAKNREEEPPDKFIDVQFAQTEDKERSLSFGFSNAVEAVDVKSLIRIYQGDIKFGSINVLPGRPFDHRYRFVFKGREWDDFLSVEAPSIVANCMLKSILKTDLIPYLTLLSIGGAPPPMKPTDTPVKEARVQEIEDREYEEAKRRKQQQRTEKIVSAHSYFDYNVLPNRKLDKYTVKADFFIKNTGTAVLENPKLCFRVDPHDRVEIGGQILPPEMSELFSLQGQTGAQGWQYAGKDWLEKAYETGEYWIESIQPLQMAPGETIKVEGVQFSIESLDEQTAATIVGFVYVEGENLQIQSQNKILITF